MRFNEQSKFYVFGLRNIEWMKTTSWKTNKKNQKSDKNYGKSKNILIFNKKKGKY